MDFQKRLRPNLKFIMSKIKLKLALNSLFVKIHRLNTLNRFKFEIVEKPINKLKFYTGILLLSVAVLGFFGIRPEFMNLYKTINLKNDLTHKKVVLEEKQKNLKDYENVNNNFSGSINRLNLAMPESLDMENYLVSINQAANLNEMYINSFSTTYLEKNTISLDITLLGKTEKIESLIKSIEELKRITKIVSIEVYNTGVVSFIKIKSEIYYLNSEGIKEPLDIYEPINGKIDVEFLRGF